MSAEAGSEVVLPMEAAKEIPEDDIQVVENILKDIAETDYIAAHSDVKHGLESLLFTALDRDSFEKQRFMREQLADLVNESIKQSIRQQEGPHIVKFRDLAKHKATSSGDLFCIEGLPSHDSDYLKRHLGQPLTLALAEIAAKKPSDPIHYLGHWLYRWRANQENRQKSAEFLEELNKERQQHFQRMRELERMEEERRNIERAERLETEKKEILSEIIGGMVAHSVQFAEDKSAEPEVLAEQVEEEYA